MLNSHVFCLVVTNHRKRNPTTHCMMSPHLCSHFCSSKIKHHSRYYPLNDQSLSCCSDSENFICIQHTIENRLVSLCFLKVYVYSASQMQQSTCSCICIYKWEIFLLIKQRGRCFTYRIRGFFEGLNFHECHNLKVFAIFLHDYSSLVTWAYLNALVYGYGNYTIPVCILTIS